ncbi:MAG: glycosyltransferase [Armatimonadetes bacterium]|nr:glycosyltransferase [Armatimonadota bacterium]
MAATLAETDTDNLSLAYVAAHYRPLVTVVMPTRDRLEILDESIQSVLAQELGDLELVIVAVTQREVSVLARRYAAESTRLARAATTATVRVVRQEGRGIAGARNMGMRVGRGVYFAHMDDDEVWTADHLPTLVGFLERYPHLALVYGDVRRCRGYFRRPQAGRPGQRLQVRRPTLREFVEREDLGTPWCRQFDFGQLVHGNWIPASAVVMRRAAFEALGGFDESIRYADDWEYWLRIASRFPVAHCCTLTTLGKATVTYRLHGGNATQRDPEVWAENLRRVRERYAEAAEGRGSPRG